MFYKNCVRDKKTVLIIFCIALVFIGTISIFIYNKNKVSTYGNASMEKMQKPTKQTVSTKYTISTNNTNSTANINDTDNIIDSTNDVDNTNKTDGTNNRDSKDDISNTDNKGSVNIADIKDDINSTNNKESTNNTVNTNSTNTNSANSDIEIKTSSQNESIKYGKLYITKNQDESIYIYNLLNDGRLLLTTFTKKEWGTYNLGAQQLCLDGKIPSEDRKSLVSGATDWEYVLIAGETKNTLNFSGGNHKNEKMIYMEFLDDEGNIIDLNQDRMIELNNLTIMEYTQLYTNNDKENTFCNIVRNYFFEPSKITFTSDFTFTKGIYLGNTYVCMFPVSKKYGNHILFVDPDKEYTTPPFGETFTKDGFENYYGLLPTLSAEIWGDESDDIRFKVSIKNRQMVDNFQNRLKVFFWDLNKNENKLYFSKYDTNSPTYITAGTVWNNKAVWEIIVDGKH